MAPRRRWEVGWPDLRGCGHCFFYLFWLTSDCKVGVLRKMMAMAGNWPQAPLITRANSRAAGWAALWGWQLGGAQASAPWFWVKKTSLWGNRCVSASGDGHCKGPFPSQDQGLCWFSPFLAMGSCVSALILLIDLHKPINCKMGNNSIYLSGVGMD